MRYLYATLLALLCSVLCSYAQKKEMRIAHLREMVEEHKDDPNSDEPNMELGICAGKSFLWGRNFNDYITRFIFDVNFNSRGQKTYFTAGTRLGGDRAAYSYFNLSVVGGVQHDFSFSKSFGIRLGVVAGGAIEVAFNGPMGNINSELTCTAYMWKRIAIGIKYYQPFFEYKEAKDRFMVSGIMLDIQARLKRE